MSNPYPELVMEHAKRPRNEGPLPMATHDARRSNPLCGDRMHLHLQLRDEVVVAARFEARGCALCRGSASILTDLVEGLSAVEARALVARLEAGLNGEPLSDAPGLEALASLRRIPGRRRCVTLAWEALQDALGPAAR